MRGKRSLVLGLAALFCAAALAGCQGKPVEAGTDAEFSMKNDGRTASLVLGELEQSSQRTEVLKEIIAKYRADFPNTQVEVRVFPTKGELESALRAGELDLAEIRGEDLAAYWKEGLLLDLYPYLQAWEERATLSPEAQQVVSSMGLEHAYVLPNGFTQDLLYYRADWFDEYNEGLETDLARCRSWDEIAGGVVDGKDLIGASEKLGDRGKLAFGGRDRLVDTFDAIVWSTVGLNRMADSGAAMFAAGDETRSIFSLERGAEGADQFRRVMDAFLPQSLDWTQDQAVEAFQEGRAGMLLADRSAMEKLESSMPQGSWAVAAFPRGRTGMAITAPRYTGWAAASSVKEPEIAAHFLTYLSNADNNTHYAKVTGAMPIHLESAEMEPSLLEGELAVEMNMMRRGDWYQYASQPTMYAACPGYRELADRLIRQWMADEISQSELLSQLDDYWIQAYQSEGRLWD